MSDREQGFTLAEVLVASVITAVVAGGTATAFVAAARMTRAQSNPGTAEASVYARQTAERFRNRMACDDPWFDAACQPTNIPSGWNADPLPSPTAAGSESVLKTGARRCYRITPQECDGAPPSGDCLGVEVRVCWNNDFTNCPC
ncbi:MAG: prepilin-type N-terminal cleavage/methylation domain-containing protein [Candidatus Omnitrophica bacterium]|nr:prepilin-type N-terminal cleavage/methylation domain-containing protein [Candidatus Omnitrophota bacterium]